MQFVYNDGGREAAGFKGKAGDCVTRAIAIVSGRPYAEVYAALAEGAGNERKGKGRKLGKSARNGIYVTRKWFKEYMASLGFVWTPTMLVGQGCKVHLLEHELPKGRLVVSVSRHLTAVIDGVIHDTFNPQRTTFWFKPGTQEVEKVSYRCVYGYYKFQEVQ